MHVPEEASLDKLLRRSTEVNKELNAARLDAEKALQRAGVSREQCVILFDFMRSSGMASSAVSSESKIEAASSSTQVDDMLGMVKEGVYDHLGDAAARSVFSAKPHTNLKHSVDSNHRR